MSEKKDVVDAVVAYAIARGWRYYKFVSPGEVGVPDDIFTKSLRQIIFIEFKDWGKTSSKKQQREQQKLREQGFEVYEVDCREVGYEIFNGR